MSKFSRRFFLLGALATSIFTLKTNKLAFGDTGAKLNALEAIMTRRSVRDFTQEAVSQEQITVLLKAAMAAPSAHNKQPWEFVVVTDRKVLSTVSKLNRYATMAKNAPLGILTCMDLNAEKNAGYAMQSVSAATQNLLLAAHATGLGAVWTGIMPTDQDLVEQWQKLYGLPENIIPMAFVIIGVPNSRPKPKDAYDANKVHQNKW